MILAIEREWAQYPGWFSTLARAHQVPLLGEYRARAREAG